MQAFVGKVEESVTAKRVEGLLIQQIEGEVLVFEPTASEAHALNEAAAIVFDLCDGATSRAAMAAEVSRRTGLPADEGVVALALGELAEAGLVALDEAEPPGESRRTLLRRLSLPLAVAALLPIVETVLLPGVSAGAPVLTPSPKPKPAPGPATP
jgi:hypothetical protein